MENNMENKLDNILISDIPIQKKEKYCRIDCSNFCGNCLFIFCSIFSM